MGKKREEEDWRLRVLSRAHILAFWAIRDPLFLRTLRIATKSELERSIWLRQASRYRYSNKGRFTAIQRRIDEIEDKENG